MQLVSMYEPTGAGEHQTNAMPVVPEALPKLQEFYRSRLRVPQTHWKKKAAGVGGS